MIVSQYRAGPYIHALGWTGDSFEPLVAASDRWGSLSAPKTSSGASRVGAEGRPFAPVELPTVLLRASGVPRARSAPRSSVYAAILGAKLRSTLSRLGPDKDRVGVAAVSSSAIVPICFDFEGVGVGTSWGATDTMLLPASIPTTVGTSVSRVTNSHAAAVTYGDGALGMLAAIEHAHVALQMDRTDAWLVLAAEEFAAPMVDALEQLGDTRPTWEGSAGLVLVGAPLNDSDWQVCGMACLGADEVPCLHPDWRAATRVRIPVESPLMAYTSMAVPWALHEAMTSGATSALVEVSVRGRGVQLLALRGQAGPKAPAFMRPRTCE